MESNLRSLSIRLYLGLETSGLVSGFQPLVNLTKEKRVIFCLMSFNHLYVFSLLLNLRYIDLRVYKTCLFMLNCIQMSHPRFNYMKDPRWMLSILRKLIIQTTVFVWNCCFYFHKKNIGCLGTYDFPICSTWLPTIFYRNYGIGYSVISVNLFILFIEVSILHASYCIYQYKGKLLDFNRQLLQLARFFTERVSERNLQRLCVGCNDCDGTGSSAKATIIFFF